jgi:membrane fusion protein, multidrug efflux system
MQRFHHFRWPLAALLLLLSACDGPAPNAAGPGAAGPPPADVNVAQVLRKEISEGDEFTGRIEAKESIELRPRVSGYIKAVHFDEGKLVRKGQLLVSIDDREYQAAAAAAAANVARARSRADLAQGELARSQKLLAVRAVSQEELAGRQAEVRQAQADFLSASAQLTQANLNVEFTQITSPIAGRAGLAMLRPGNLVQAGQSVLTSVVSVDPMYVYFEGDENAYLKYQSMARSGERPSSRDVQNPVRMGLANETGYPHAGYMDFVDNQLNPQTGSIRARAVFDNKDGMFTPGLFARIQLLGSGKRTAMLINDRAVQTDQNRKFVWTVGPKDSAVRKDVVLGNSVEGLRVVLSGLEASDQIVINGSSKIFFPGAPLKVTIAPMDQPDFVAPATANAEAGKAAP